VWTDLIQDDFDYEPTQDQSILALSEATGQSCLEIAYDHLMSDDGTGVIWRGSSDVTRWYDVARSMLMQVGEATNPPLPTSLRLCLGCF